MFLHYKDPAALIHTRKLLKNTTPLDRNIQSHFRDWLRVSFCALTFRSYCRIYWRQLTAFRSSVDRSGSRNKAVGQGYVTTVVGV